MRVQVRGIMCSVTRLRRTTASRQTSNSFTEKGLT